MSPEPAAAAAENPTPPTAAVSSAASTTIKPTKFKSVWKKYSPVPNIPGDEPQRVFERKLKVGGEYNPVDVSSTEEEDQSPSGDKASHPLQATSSSTTQTLEVKKEKTSPPASILCEDMPTDSDRQSPMSTAGSSPATVKRASVLGKIPKLAKPTSPPAKQAIKSSGPKIVSLKPKINFGKSKLKDAVKNIDSTESTVPIFALPPKDKIRPPALSTFRRPREENPLVPPPADRKANPPAVVAFGRSEPIFTGSIPESSISDLQSPKLVEDEVVFRTFVIREAKYILTQKNASMDELLKKLVFFVDNASVLSKYDTTDGNLVTEKALIDLEKYQSAYVFLPVQYGEQLLKKINGMPIPPNIANRLNRAPKETIPFAGLRTRLASSIPLKYDEKMFFNALANLLSVALPCYIKLSKDLNNTICFSARLKEEWSLSSEKAGTDVLRQTKLIWRHSKALSAGASRKFSLVSHALYMKPQLLWRYEDADSKLKSALDQHQAADFTRQFILADRPAPQAKSSNR